MLCSAILVILGTALCALAQDPCSILAGERWVSPKDVRACYRSFKLEQAEKDNILDVVRKSIAFHASTNYQIRAPPPAGNDVHVNLYRDLARISRQRYRSDYDFHLDLSSTFKRLQDGHCVWINYCYDNAYISYLPVPLSLITDENGRQSVHIAFEAYDVVFGEFGDQLEFWENALPGDLQGQLRSLAGAKVLAINGRNPFRAVDQNAAIAGTFQSFATRQNSFFSSYQRSSTGWTYIMGNFAEQSLPLDDAVTLRILRQGQSQPETIQIPYRSRVGTKLVDFTDSTSYRENNCKAVADTNGVNVYEVAAAAKSKSKPVREPLMNKLMDAGRHTDVFLPPSLLPFANPLDGSFEVAQFYMLNDGITGVLALGSFSVTNSQYFKFLDSLVNGLAHLKSLGATQLVVDVSNNAGGFICAAHWLHRIISGPKSTTVPQAGLNTTARVGPLASEITNTIVRTQLDHSLSLLYNPLNWRQFDNSPFDAEENWLEPPVRKFINGHRDAFSPTLGQECYPEGFPNEGPKEALFEGSKVVIASNGRCASSCALFSITMKKLEGARTVVMGGKKRSRQEYCGIVGGQSTSFSSMDTEVKSTELKDHPLAPPDLLVNGAQGLTWRLGYGIDNPNEPEEWQEHWADMNMPITPETSNNPELIWHEIARQMF